MRVEIRKYMTSLSEAQFYRGNVVVRSKTQSVVRYTQSCDQSKCTCFAGALSYTEASTSSQWK